MKYHTEAIFIEKKKKKGYFTPKITVFRLEIHLYNECPLFETLYVGGTYHE